MIPSRRLGRVLVPAIFVVLAARAANAAPLPRQGASASGATGAAAQTLLPDEVPRPLSEEERARMPPEQLDRALEQGAHFYAEWVKTEPKAWSHRLVAGTNVRIWVRGQPAELDRFVPMVQQVWQLLPRYMPSPLSDNGPAPIGVSNPTNSRFNPDGAIDLFFARKGAANPRCFEANGVGCFVYYSGVTTHAEPATGTGGPRSHSGYCVIDKNQPDHILTDTIAHELTHASQNQFDWEEKGYSSWLVESTAAWVAVKIVTDLGLEASFDHEQLTKDGFFEKLHTTLPRGDDDAYSSYLFFFSASIDLGDAVARRIWDEAKAKNGIGAVSAALPLDEVFPKFAVRNWNQDELPKAWRYSTYDTKAFPSSLRPSQVTNVKFTGPGTDELTQPVPGMAARYYRFSFPDSIRRVTFENLFQNQPNAHVWALRKVGSSDWKEPEDWTKASLKVYCRDLPTEDVSELIVIVSNTTPSEQLSKVPARPLDFPPGPRPIVLAEDVGCPMIEGWAKATLRMHDDGQDVSYRSSMPKLLFRPRSVQDQPGDIQYDLLATSVTWTVNGRRGDCTIQGQATIAIPAYVDQPLDPLRPAWGYLNIVSADGGDFHSLRIAAANPGARVTQTCPGSPPSVTQVPLDAAWLALVLSEKNIHGPTALYKGTQTFDPARLQDTMPMTPGAAASVFTQNGSALAGVSNFPGLAGMLPPSIMQKLQEAQAALEKNAAENSGRIVYTFDWELRPK